jgi:hypothetical protein
MKKIVFLVVAVAIAFAIAGITPIPSSAFAGPCNPQQQQC